MKAGDQKGATEIRGGSFLIIHLGRGRSHQSRDLLVSFDMEQQKCVHSACADPDPKPLPPAS